MDMVVADDGCRLWTTGTGTGDPLVLCHGGPGFWDTFEDLADLEAVLDHHGLVRVSLLGHSWGAELALRYTLAHPDRVTSPVYVSGIGVDPEETWHDDYERNLRDRLGGHLDRFQELEGRARRTETEEREFDLLWLSADFVDRDRSLELAERLTTPFLGMNRECARALNADRRRSSGGLLGACANLAVPVLLVDGAHDVRPRWAVDSLERALPAVRRVVLEGAGHLPWVDEPAAFRAAVTGFLTAAPEVS